MEKKFSEDSKEHLLQINLISQIRSNMANLSNTSPIIPDDTIISTTGSKLSFSDITALQIAEQLTCIEDKLYKSVDRLEIGRKKTLILTG